MRPILFALGLVIGLLVVLTQSCGSEGSDAWRVTLRGADGRGIEIPELTIVVFDTEDGPPRLYGERSYEPFVTHLELPPLAQGRYELWLPGRRPVRIQGPPPGPYTLAPGPAVDVIWPSDASVPAGAWIGVQATWRGPGDDPATILRASLPAAAPAPGLRSWQFTRFVDGVVFDPAVGRARVHVPWPGPYRLRWGTARFEVREGPGLFSASGGSTRSPGDEIGVVVPADGSVPTVTLRAE